MALSKEEQERIKKLWGNRHKGSSTVSSNGGGSGTGTGTSMLSDKDKDWIKQSWSKRFDVDDIFINTFISDANDFLNNAQTNYNKLDYKSATAESSLGYYKAMQQTENDLGNRAWKIQNYLKSHKGEIDEETYTSLSSFLDNFSSPRFSQQFFDARDYYSQWDTEDAYIKGASENREARQKRYEDNQKRIEELMAGASVEDLLYGNVREELERLAAENQQYERGEGGWVSKVRDDYFGVTQSADFETSSANRNHGNPTRDELTKYDALTDSSTWYYDENDVLRDAYGNEIVKDSSGNLVSPEANNYTVKDRLGVFLSATDRDIEEYMGTIVSGTWGNIIGEGIDGSWDQLYKDEIDIYYYLLNTSGQETADKYLADMKTELNRRETMQEIGQWHDSYDEAGFLEKIALNAATFPAKFLSNITGTVTNTVDTLQGKDINPYSYANRGMHFSQTVRGDTAEELDETGFKIPLIDFTLGDIYQTGMSRIDSALATSVFGGGGTVFLGMGAAQEEAYELYKQGASAEQITLGAFSAGVAEVFWEKFSYGKLKEIEGKDIDTIGKWVKSILIQGGNEALEEAGTEVSNIVTNALVMGSQSDLAELYKKNEESAFRTFKDLLKQTTHSAFGGFIGGAFAGGGQATSAYAHNTSQYRNAGKTIMSVDGGVDALKNLANEVAGVSEGKMKDSLTKQAGKVSGEVATGDGIRKVGAAIKNASNETKIGRLYNKVQNANNLANASANQADIAKSLMRNDFDSKTANDIAEALVASYNGQELTKKQSKLLESVKDNQDVQDAISNIMANEQSTMGQRSQNIRDFQGDIYKGAVTKSITEAIRNNTTAKQFTPAGEYEVSDSGKAINTEAGEDIDIKGVSAISNGKMVLELADGTTIDAKSVSFASESDALIYEAVANLGDNISAETANKLIAKYDGSNATVFAKGMAQAYTYGFYGIDRSEMTGEHSLATELTKEQRNYAYGLGEQYRSVKDQADKAKARARKAPGEKGVFYRDKDGNATDIRSYFDHLKKDGRVLNEMQTTGIEFMEKMSKMMGVRFNVFESWVENGTRYYLNENGEKTEGSPNGFYDPKTGEIYIDLFAGNDFQGTMLFTVAHELTHFMRQWSPEHFTKIAKLVFSHAGFKGSVSSLVADKMNSKRRPDYDTALEEVVADGMETILKDGKVAEFMADVKKTDSKVWEKLKEWFKNFAEFLKKMVDAYSGQSAQTKEGKKVADFSKKLLTQIEQIWAEGAVSAGENYQAALENVVEENAEAVSSDEIITDGAVVTDGQGTKFSIKSMKHDIAEGQMFEDLKTYCGWTQQQVTELRQNLEDLVEYMTPNRGILDMNESYGRDGRRFSPYKPNSDPLYKISMDFSTLCSKRLLTQYVIENLQLRENRPMSAEEQMAIRDMLNEYRKVEKGLQVACAMCYVEAARLKSPKQIQRWLNDPAPLLRDYFGKKNKEFNDSVKEAQADFKESRGYARNAPKKDMKPADVKELNKIGPKLRSKYQLSAEEQAIVDKAKTLPNSVYLTAGNLSDLSETDPVIYDAYTAFVRTATRSKSLETDEPYYYGDSRRDNGNGIVVSDSFIEAVNRENGMRFSSWSDWRIQHLLDYITAVIDNSVRGAAMHGYTKFGEEVRVLGKTGMMFNMSGVAGTQTGLNPDGSLSFSATESIDVNEAIQLREEFPETAGLQCIGVSDAHIIALLKSDIIDYVIPYHVSGLNAALRRMADIYGWDDYTGTQNASIDKSIKKENAADPEHWHEEPAFSEFFVGYDTGMSGIEAMRASAERYKQMCKDRGLTPKFNQFANEANYWKLLIDRKMINQQTGDLIRQKAVTPTFDFNTIKGVVDRYVDNYDSGLEARALNHIVENWDSIPKRIKDLKKQGGTKAKKTKKAVDTLANQTLAAQPATTKFSDRVTDPETLAFLNEQIRKGEVTEVYRAMAQDDDGNLYPPMAGFVRKNGKKVINGHPSIIGEWEQSTESIKWDSVDEEFLIREGFKHFEKPTKDYPNGRFEKENTIFYRNKAGEWKAKFHLDKDNGATVDAAYAPYIHTSLSVLNDQFTSAYTRDNLVVVRGYVPNSEVNGVDGKRYQANFADKPVGKTKWHSGVVAAQMPETRTVILSRYFMPIEKVDDAVFAQKTKEMMQGKDIEIPFNVVTPNQRRALEAIGVRIGEARGLRDAPKKADVKYSDRILMGSLFSGGGTLEAGLAYQMLDKQFGVEYDGRIAAVYAQNHGDHIQVGRVEDFDISKYEDVFYLHASPVCHNFSKAKHGATELQMDIDSAKATAKHLETAMPQVFTVENAPAYRKSESLKIITNKLTELGYKWDVDVYNSADYGSATSRNRVILRAVKDGELPAKPAKQERTNSWDKVTRDLWDTLPKATLRPSFISAIENTRNLPILDANGKVNVNKPLLILTTTSGHMVTYCWEGDICPTLTTKCGEARLVMPDGNIYAVTPEFMGRIQGLPDDYKYPKEKTRAFTIIGNGIPTHLTKAVVGGVLDSAYEQTHGKALYSDRDDAPSFGYHAGDLGKAEGYWNMVSANRGTGHFGTGTYFVGDEAKINDSHYGNRPHEKVDFDNYHLFRPVLKSDGFDLHSALKYINDNIFDYPIAKMSFDELWDVRKQADEAEYTLWDDDATDAEKATAQKVLDDFKERFKSVGYDPSRMDAQELYEELNDITKEYHLTRSKLEMIFWRDMGGLSYEEQSAKIDSIMQGIYDEVSQIEDAYAAKYEDSPSTRFMKALGYEGIDVRGFKELDNTTYGSVIYDLKGEDLARKESIGTAKFQDRTEDSVSNRSLLANAFEGIAKPEELQKIQEYKDKVALINEEERKLRELNEQIKELSFAKGPRDNKKIKALRFDAVQAANRINTYDKQLLRLEASEPLQKVLNREKKLAYKKAEQRGKEALAEYKAKVEAKQKETAEKWRESRNTAVAKARETAEKRDARAKLQKLVLDTVKWISYPAKTDVKCPDILKKPYEAFLQGIDLSSKRLANGGEATNNDLRLANAMDSLATAIDRVMLSQDPTQEVDKVLDIGYLDLPADFVQKLRDMTESIKSMMVEGEYVVNNMTASEVRQLSQMIRTLNHAIKTMSNLYANLRFANVEALGFDTMDFLDAVGEIEKTGGMKDFVQWDNALPYYAFKRFGAGGESVFEGLMDAQDKLAYLAKDIFDFQEKTWTGKEAKEWSEDTHTITLPNGNELKLTTADAMSIYCLSRREQALPHLLGGGIRVMGIQKGSQKAKDSRSLLTIEDVSAIISSLTDRQKQVAEGIQEFMSTVCSDWGNEISMKRFLTREFTEKFYFPIESNDENLTVKDPAAQQSDLFRLLNISATKPLTQGANNEVIIRNIFDVFVGHASDMARLNAYGMGLLDYMKWLNYRERGVNEEGQINVKGVRKSMEQAYGKAANSYVLNLIKDVNGRASDGGDPTILMKWMRAAKTASVGSSLRVATLQITSYPRAALVLSPKSLALGFTKAPNINKAKKYCGIALWKSFGFYDTNISRSIEDQMKGVTNIKQKLIELSLKGAEWGDAITWGALWNACEYEVAKTTNNKVGSEEFNIEVGKKLRDVVYRTQVVDSTLTRSQIMRSKRGMAQEAAAFMSEPTLSANILMDAGFEFGLEKRRTGSAKSAWKKTGSYIGRAVAVYSIGQLTAALLEGLWDAWRDDDDEEFGEKYLSAFVENLALDLVPFNKLPIISDVFEAALSMFGVGFYSSDKMSTTWLTQALSAVEAWKKVLSGESSTTAYNAFYKSTRAVSSMLGISISGVMREGVALWNNTAGAYDSTLKIRQYDLANADLGTELYEAIISGNTRQADSLKTQFEDANSMHSAVRKALRENDPRIKEAAIAGYNGDPSERVRIAKLIIADGFDQDDVVAAINAEVNDMKPDEPAGDPKKKGFYTATDFATEIANGDQASAYVAKEDIIATAQKNGKTEEEAKKSFVSSAKTELKKLFKAGTISEQKLIDTLVAFCDMEKDDAEKYAGGAAFEVAHPELDGIITYSQYQRWESDGQPRGVSLEMFVDVASFRDDGTSNSVKSQDEVALYISSVTSDPYLRDALWCCFYNESTLKNAPWH